jgi:thiosulfate reductase cytochrome b subunit
MMSKNYLRYLSVFFGIVDLAVAAGLLLLPAPQADGVFGWWARGLLFAIFMLMALTSFRRGIFAAPDDRTEIPARHG